MTTDFPTLTAISTLANRRFGQSKARVEKERAKLMEIDPAALVHALEWSDTLFDVSAQAYVWGRIQTMVEGMLSGCYPGLTDADLSKRLVGHIEREVINRAASSTSTSAATNMVARFSVRAWAIALQDVQIELR